MKRWTKLVIALSFFSSGLALAQSPSYHVGLAHLTVAARGSSPAFALTVMYPTMAQSSRVHFGPYSLPVALSAPVAQGRFALVILSHGSAGSGINYRMLALTLVRHGYIVGLPLHPGDNYRDSSQAGLLSVWRNRPKQIEYAIDRLVTDRSMATHILPHRIAVIGHSAGGYAALVAAGGKADTPAMIDYCHTHLRSAEPTCQRVKNGQLPPAQIEQTADSRIKALVLLAPVGIFFRRHDSLALVTQPVLLITAQADSVLTPSDNAELIAKRLPNQRQLVNQLIPNAGHFSFLSPFPKALQGKVGVVGEDPSGFDRRSFQHQLGRRIVAFFQHSLSKF
ncbi:alpha/beta hydrolase family protein [Celerinatantimonas diazotrophica]|nr:alpha/beta fold hydrolase [Celerinatantimonas diazotrophica]